VHAWACVCACGVPERLGLCMRIRAYSLANPARNAYAPCCDVIYGPSVHSINLLTSCSRVLTEKLTGSQLVKKFTQFMEPKNLLPYSQQPATCPYPERDRSSPCTLFQSLNIYFTFHPSRSVSFKLSPSLRFPHPRPSIRATRRAHLNLIV
jgi:hypothetical protein